MKAEFLSILVCLIVSASAAFAQTTEFTYQGKLNQNNTPATGNYDMQFRLWNDPNAGQGTQQGATVNKPNVAVTDGIFTVNLDFGTAVFASGADRFLEISVRPAGDTGGYTSLAPRQKLTSAPYAIRSKEAATADNLSGVCVGCIQSANISSVEAAKISGTLPIANGGTGSATKNFVDLSTDQTINGNKTFNGTISANSFVGDGSGLRNVVSNIRLSGSFSDIPPNSQQWVFAQGAVIIVQPAGNQRVLLSAGASLRTNGGTAVGVGIGFCYQNMSSGDVTPFTETTLTVDVTTNRFVYAVNGIGFPAAGASYIVGYCIQNPTSATISGNTTGWVMLTSH